MARKQRVVVDTNVIVSSLLLADSAPQRALFVAQAKTDLLLSDDVVAELNAVLGRPAFDRYLDSATRQRFLHSLIACAHLVPITERVQACRDPRDDIFLELAVNGDADLIVSGDRDLLDMRSFRHVAILTPRQFLDRFEST
jgi:putative PIN family toxin of toxin-antitoxin system